MTGKYLASLLLALVGVCAVPATQAAPPLGWHGFLTSDVVTIEGSRSHVDRVDRCLYTEKGAEPLTLNVRWAARSSGIYLSYQRFVEAQGVVVTLFKTTALKGWRCLPAATTPDRIDLIVSISFDADGANIGASWRSAQPLPDDAMTYAEIFSASGRVTAVVPASWGHREAPASKASAAKPASTVSEAALDEIADMVVAMAEVVTRHQASCDALADGLAKFVAQNRAKIDLSNSLEEADRDRLLNGKHKVRVLEAIARMEKGTEACGDNAKVMAVLESM